MSSSMLAATTDVANCHVKTLLDEEELTFALGSTAIHSIAVSGNTVAVLYIRSLEDSMNNEVTIWTLNSKTPLHCRIKLRESPSKQTLQGNTKIMLGTKMDYLIVFERSFTTQSFHFTRLGLDGRFHSQGSLQVPDTTRLTTSLETSLPSDLNGSAMIWSYSHSHEMGTPTLSNSSYVELTRVQYEPQRNKLQLETNQIMCGPNDLIPKRLFIWNDVAYYRERDFENLRIIDLCNNATYSAATMNTDGRTEFNPSSGLRRVVGGRGGLSESYFLGDTNFLVSVCDRGFQAWCFNKDIKMVDENKYYAQHRHMVMQKRLEEKRVQDAKATH